SLFFEQVSPISMRCTSASIPYGLIWLNSALNVQDFPISKLTPISASLTPFRNCVTDGIIVVNTLFYFYGDSFD
ncbi:hypothetical protein U5E81_18810, partial [Proteus mirabilis]|nr:hypothetical protein [Proteus mirabilis]